MPERIEVNVSGCMHGVVCTDSCVIDCWGASFSEPQLLSMFSKGSFQVCAQVLTTLIVEKDTGMIQQQLEVFPPTLKYCSSFTILSVCV